MKTTTWICILLGCLSACSDTIADGDAWAVDENAPTPDELDRNL